jgi:hypothetical protein
MSPTLKKPDPDHAAFPENFLSVWLSIALSRAAPEESRGGPINYSDADKGDLVPIAGETRQSGDITPG